MGKKESRKKENNLEPNLSEKSFKLGGFSVRIFGLIKFAMGICLLPFVYSTSVSFLNEFGALEKALQNYFWSGLISLLIIYLFIWEPAVIYTRGQKILEIVFAFFKPLVRVAPYLVPIYTILLFTAYWILSFIWKSSNLINYFLFLFGFTVGLHLIFSAKSIRSKQQDFLKANYIFGFSFIYIVNLIFVCLFLNLIFEEFSLVNFFNNSFQAAKGIFSAVLKQLFLR